jgi:hypothetical protein
MEANNISTKSYDYSKQSSTPAKPHPSKPSASTSTTCTEMLKVLEQILLVIEQYVHLLVHLSNCQLLLLVHLENLKELLVHILVGSKLLLDLVNIVDAWLNLTISPPLVLRPASG